MAMQVPRGGAPPPGTRLSPQYQQQGVRAAQPWQPQVPAQSLRTAPRTNGGSYEPHPQSVRTVPRGAGGSYEPQPQSQSLRTSPRNAGASGSYVPPPESLRNTPRSAAGGGSYVPPEVRPSSCVPPTEVRPCSGTGSYVATPQSPGSPVLAGMARRALSPHGFPERQGMQSSASLSSLPPAHDGASQVPPRVAVPRGQGAPVSGHLTPMDRRGESAFPWAGAEAAPAARAHSQGARSCMDLRNGSHSGPLPRTPHGSGSNSHARATRQDSARRDSARGDSTRGDSNRGDSNRGDSARDSARGGRDGTHSHGSGHGQGAAHGASTRAQSIGSCRSSSLLSLHDGGCPSIERRDAGDNVSHSNSHSHRPTSRNASATSGDRVRSPPQESSRNSRGSRLGAQTVGSTRLGAPSNRAGQSGRPHAAPVKSIPVHVTEIDCHPGPPIAQIVPSVTPTSSPPDTPGFADMPGHSSGPRSATATNLDRNCQTKGCSVVWDTALVSSPQSEQRQTPERDAPRRAPRRTDHHGASDQLLIEIQEVRARLCEAKDKIVERDEHIERLREREAELNAELTKVRHHGQRKNRCEHEVASASALEKEAKVDCKVAEMQARAQDLQVQEKDLASQRSELAKAKEELAEHRRLLRQQQEDLDAQVDANHDKEGVLRERMMHLAEAERNENDDRRKIDETLASLKDREAEVRKQEQAIRQRERAVELRERDAGSREADLEVLRERELNLKDQEERLRRWQKQLEEREQQHIEAVKEAEVLKLKLNPGSRRSPRAGKENQELKRQIEEQQTRMKEIKQVGWQQQVPE